MKDIMMRIFRKTITENQKKRGSVKLMILELVFILGMIVGFLSAGILFFIFFPISEYRSKKKFEKRQERYRRMI